jgi:hypothetical protein
MSWILQFLVDILTDSGRILTCDAGVLVNIGKYNVKQTGEQRSENPCVHSSILCPGTKNSKALQRFRCKAFFVFRVLSRPCPAFSSC